MVARNYRSPRHPGDELVTARNADRFVLNDGRIPRDYAAEPLCGFSFAKAFPRELYIPENEWAEIIQQKDAEKSRLSDRWVQADIEALDQSGTNYCWCFAVVTALETMRLQSGLPFVRLSPASVAAFIKNFRNIGGWGSQALRFMVEQHGPCSADLWPQTWWKSDKYWTDEAKANAQLHRVTEYLDIPQRDFAAVMSLVLRNIPVPVGYNWMGHEICALDGVILQPGKYGLRLRDNYRGLKFRLLDRRQGTPDDACAVLTVPASVA